MTVPGRSVGWSNVACSPDETLVRKLPALATAPIKSSTSPRSATLLWQASSRYLARSDGDWMSSACPKIDFTLESESGMVDSLELGRHYSVRFPHTVTAQDIL